MTFHQSQSFESSKPNSSIYSSPCSICWASEAQGGPSAMPRPRKVQPVMLENCILGGILCHLIHLILTSLQGSYTFVGGTWHLSKVSMEFLRGWREDWPGKNDETWTFWRHIGPLGRTVWGLDRIPLKDLKVGEEVDGRVKGRYRSMGWFLVRKVSLERGGIHYFPRGHTYRWAVLQCLHEMIDWGILVPKSVEVEKLGRRGYFRFIYIYIYHLKLSPCLHLTSFLFSHHPPTWIDKLHPRTSAIKNKATRQHEWNQTSKDITQKNKQEANQSTSPPSPKSVYILYIYVRVNTHNIHQLCL